MGLALFRLQSGLVGDRAAPRDLQGKHQTAMTVKSAAVLCALALIVWVRPAYAAKSYDQCQYYVDAIPAVITTPGMWCLRNDLKVSGYANSAINIQASNATLDCKDFSLDGTAITPAEAQWGIVSDRQHGVTVRNCNVRGFLYGISFYNTESKGNSVVNNRLERNYVSGIYVVGDGSKVSGNIILDTGSSEGASGISAVGEVDVTNNLIAGVSGGTSNVTGISTGDFTGQIIGNRIRGLSQGFISHPSVAISIVGAANAIVRDNDISGDGLPITAGIWCRFATGRVKGNVIKGMETALMECDLGQDNDVSN